MNKFKDLVVYKKALAFTKVVRQTTKSFPKDEAFGLSSQFRRTADSIVLNIAEGSGNTSQKEFGRYLDYSIRSGFECIGCLDIALENDLIDQTAYSTMADQVKEITAMLYGLKKSL